MQHLEVSGAVRPLQESLGVKGLSVLTDPSTRQPLGLQQDPNSISLGYNRCDVWYLCWMISNTGLCSFKCCSGMSRLLW